MKYIDADRLNADLDKWVEAMADAEGDYSDGVRFAIQHFIFLLASLLREQPEVGLEKKFTFPKFLFARTLDNKTIDISYAPQNMEAVEYVRNDFIEQEQPETDGDNGKFVKILVRKEFAEQLQKLGDEIQAGQFSFVGAMNQREQSDFPITDEQVKEFLATHPKIEVPEKYKNPDWLFKKQEQPEVDLEKETKRWWKEHLHLNPENKIWMDAHQSVVFARYFYELGKNSK